MDSKEDDEISIDLGKIKNFFKSGKKEEEKKAENEPVSQTNGEKKDDDELNLSFDADRIKKFFKSGGEWGKGDEEISVNWGKAIDFFKKYGIVFIALIPIILSIYIRIQAGFLPITDDWAANSVISGIKSQIRSSIDQQYPNLPDANKNALVETELQKVIGQNKQQIDQQITATSAYFRSFFQDESGKLYMPDIDPYYWFRYAKNIVEHGYPGDILKDGRSFDTHQLAPIGRFVVPDMFHSYMWAYFYKLLNFFIHDLTLMRSGFYLVIFFSAVCVLLVFLIARKIAGNIGGFFAGLMMAVNGAFLSRSLHPDNDVWVVLFPLIVTWLFIYTIDLSGKFKIISLAALAGFFTGLFTTAWSGWWYIFDFLLATIAITFLYLVLVNFSEVKKSLWTLASNTAIRNAVIVGLVYFFSTLAFVVLFSGWRTFSGSFLGPLSFPSIKAPVSADLWPNVFTTVAELNEGSINGIINSIGGQFLFFISLLGLILAISRKDGIRKFDFFYIIGTIIFYGAYFLLRRVSDIPVFGLLLWIMLPIFARIGISIYKKDSSYDFKLSILLSLWIVSTIFASIKGIRFTLLLAPAFSVAFGVALGKIYGYASKWLTKELKIHRLIAASILIVMLLWIFYVDPARGAVSAARSDVPMINDAWHNTLTAIKQNSSENAIITSWWDFGHHFKALADRRVTFDGTTQTYPAAHWVGKLLMTDSEEQAIGILRMLDCGSNNAFNALYSANKDTGLSLKILNEIILLDKKEAENKLKSSGFDGKQAEKILSFTHCEAPEAYFIASEDMIGKSGVWSHFGSWNFERAEIWQNRKLPQEQAVERMMNRYNYTKEKAENTYFEVQAIASDSEANSWVAPWPGYGGVVGCSKNSNEVYACSNGLQVNLSSYDAFGIGQQGITRPKTAAFTTENGIFQKWFNGTTLEFGMTIIPKNENDLEAVLSSKELTGGMFTRMFYMQGHGLKYFKLFRHEKGLTGTDIYTYKIDWSGKDAAVNDDYVKYLKAPAIQKNDSGIDSSKNNTNSS
jgi:dolichyl-diphosphooligosaccharide--protein glycosyltransferase